MAAAPRSRSRGSVELVRFLANPLAYLDALRDDDRALVPFTLGNLPCRLVTSPEQLRLALHNDSWPPLSRGRLGNLRRWYTTGLFLTYGPDHHRQRDGLWKPLFSDPRLPALAVERTARRADGWHEDEPLELYGELRRLGWTIDWQALTGEELDETTFEALRLGVEALAWLPLPWGTSRWNWPVPQSRRTRDAKRLLDERITRLIAERRARPADDLVTRLVQLGDGGAASGDDELRATVQMWFGADQLHALFTWTFHLLAANPDAEARWHAELDRVLDGRDPTLDDVRALPYTKQVLKESMRVIPPVWGFFRQTTGDFELGGDVVPKGHLMAMSPWFTHRDPRLWQDPQRFDPDRWADDAARPPEVSYFPFSAGPYECHGAGLAMQQAVLMLATIGRRWSLRPVRETPPTPTATWATEPKRSLHMRLLRR